MCGRRAGCGERGGCRRSGGERFGAIGERRGALVSCCRCRARWGVSRVEMWDRGVRGDAAPSADSSLCVCSQKVYWMFNRHRRQREVGKPRREVEQRAVADETVQTATEAWVKYGPKIVEAERRELLFKKNYNKKRLKIQTKQFVPCTPEQHPATKANRAKRKDSAASTLLSTTTQIPLIVFFLCSRLYLTYSMQ